MSTATPTAPLPAVAAEAMRSLELRLAAVQYRQASDRYRDLCAAGDFDGCLLVQDEMRACRCQLADAGRLDLIGGA